METGQHSTQPPPLIAGRLRYVYAGWAISLLALAGITAILPIYRGHLQTYYGLDNTRFGILLSGGGLIGIAGALVGGMLVDLLGAVRMLRICLLGCVISLGLAALPGNWLLMVAALGMIAMFVAPLGIAVQAYLLALFPDHRRRLLTLNLIAMSVVGILLPLLGEALLYLGNGNYPGIDFPLILHAPFAVTALILLAGWWVFLGAPVVAPAKQRPTHSAMQMISWPVAFLVLLSVLHSSFDTATYFWMSKVLASKSFLNEGVKPGVVMASMAAAYVVSRVLLTLLPERKGGRSFLFLPGLLGGSALLLGLFSHSQWGLAVGYVSAAFCWSIEYPTFLTQIAKRASHFGFAMGWQALFCGILTFLVSTGLGAFGDSLGDANLWRILIPPACGFLCIGILGALWAWRYWNGEEMKAVPS